MATVGGRLSRRELLAGLGAAAGLVSCRRSRPGARTFAPARGLSVRELRFTDGPGAPQLVVVLMPAMARPDERFPLLVALHGRGEANRGLEVGAWAWVRDYWLDRTAAALRRPPLEMSALQDLGTPSYLGELNRGLAARAYGGLVVACPATPDILGLRDLDAAAPFARFLVEVMLPRLRRETPVLPAPSATGIDGVSLGGRVALLVGLRYPEAFGAVGTLQAAFRRDEIAEVAARARETRQRTPAPPRLRLLTSEDDPFSGTIIELAAALRAAGWPAELRMVPGPHDYDFNRGAGGVEMLLWHDRALRG